MLDGVEIGYLADHPEWAAPIARWWLEEWKTLYPTANLEATTRALYGAMQHNDIPLVLVASLAGEPIGSVALLDNDMAEGLTESPWLGNLYVHPEHRGEGVARLLVFAAEQKATSLGIGKLYVKVPDAGAYFSQMGYQPLRTLAAAGKRFSLLRKELN